MKLLRPFSGDVTTVPEGGCRAAAGAGDIDAVICPRCKSTQNSWVFFLLLNFGKKMLVGNSDKLVSVGDKQRGVRRTLKENSLKKCSRGSVATYAARIAEAISLPKYPAFEKYILTPLLTSAESFLISGITYSTSASEISTCSKEKLLIDAEWWTVWQLSKLN